MFRFQQFQVEDGRSAMKVGTDGVLLGAWATADNPMRILDIGTGCGLIALMLAQRFSEADVTGIELDEEAAKDACENVVASPFSSRVRIIIGDVLRYRFEEKDGYDFIVSNPPYHEEDLLPPDEERAKARHTGGGGLTFVALLESVKALLRPTGTFAVILPFHAAESFLLLAVAYGLYPCRRTEVVTRAGKAPRRILLELSFRPLPLPDSNCLILQDGTKGRSKAYSELCREFYLKQGR